jgi:hypothetical protein
MKVLNLCCALDHHFEGWFGSEADYLSQHERGLIACPLCADTAIKRLPTAPHVHTSNSRVSTERESVSRELVPALVTADPQAKPDESHGNALVPTRETSVQLTQQAAWMRAVQHVMANTDDVGKRFAEEARRIHYGESEERAIRGQATMAEAKALVEEGIAVVPLPVPAALKGTLQ